jgi:hypothetical protein
LEAGMIDPREIREHIVRPALKAISLWSDVAEELVMMTGMIESNYSHIVQVRGPAKGLWQMEPRTHDDIWDNYLTYQPDLRHRLYKIMLVQPPALDPNRGAEELVYNLQYAAAMCRIHYWRIPAALPDPTVLSLAEYWKHYYNTILGKGKIKDFQSRGKRMWTLEQIPYSKANDWKSNHHNFGSQAKDF